MEQSHREIAPISEEYPAGTDVRYEPEFEELQAEIDKLSLPSATSGVDWERVWALSSQILTKKSKDLLVASYFTVADIRLHGVPGFFNGLSVYSELLAQYWESLFPAKKRMRGRLAAVAWLIEKSEAAFEGFNVDPVESEVIISLTELIQKIDTILSKQCDDPPLLRPLERIIENIPVREDPVTEQIAEEPPEKPEQHDPAKEKREAAAAPPDNRPERQTETVTPAPVISSTSSASAAEIEKILREALQTVRQVAAFYFDKDNSNPRGYRCRRIAGWALIQTLPLATDKQTQIPPPGEMEATRKHLLELRGLERWQELLREAEKRFNSSLLWLDLNRFSAESLTGLGSQYHQAHDAVCQETAFLLKRLPGLEKLTFLDGSPLADAETRHWLETIIPAEETMMRSPVIQTGGGNEEMDQRIEQCRTLAASKKLTEAVGLMNQEMSHCGGRHAKLLWRINLIQLLLNYHQNRLVLPHLDDMITDIDTFRLEEWDPQLAVVALRTVWLGFRNDKSAKEKASAILARIARIDPVEAMRLEK